MGLGVLLEWETGAKVLPRAHAAVPAPAAHATGRQRREGSEPVGKSSRANATNPKPRKNSEPNQWPQAWVWGKCSSSVPPLMASAYDAPVADMSQPIGFAERFQISSAPTVAKPPMNMSAATTAAAFPAPAACPGGNGYRRLKISGLPAAASVSTQMLSAHQNAVRGFMLRPADRGSPM